MEDDTIREIANIFYYQWKGLNEGIKYLGYHIMPNNYMIAIWKWLLQKFGERVSN